MSPERRAVAGKPPAGKHRVRPREGEAGYLVDRARPAPRRPGPVGRLRHPVHAWLHGVAPEGWLMLTLLVLGVVALLVVLLVVLVVVSTLLGVGLPADQATGPARF